MGVGVIEPINESKELVALFKSLIACQELSEISIEKRNFF